MVRVFTRKVSKERCSSDKPEQKYTNNHCHTEIQAQYWTEE